MAEINQKDISRKSQRYSSRGMRPAQLGMQAENEEKGLVSTATSCSNNWLISVTELRLQNEKIPKNKKKEVTKHDITSVIMYLSLSKS